MAELNVDTDALRALGAEARGLATAAVNWKSSVSSLLSQAHLEASDVGQLCGEIDEEMGLFADLAEETASNVEASDEFGVCADPTTQDDLFSKLADSLGDDVGSTGIVGENALGVVEQNFDEIDTDGTPGISRDELAAAAESSDPTIAAAAQYLRDNETLLQHLVAQSNPGQDQWALHTPITKDGLQAMREQAVVLRDLARPDVFTELDEAKNGEQDGIISVEDLKIVADDPNSSADARRAAQYLLDHQAALGSLDLAKQNAKAGFLPPASTSDDGMISQDDVIALSIARQVHAVDPKGAREFATSLAPRATWTDPSGKSTGIDMFMIDDDGLKALAASALADADKLSDKVMVVSALPESPGGVRNRLITYYYQVLGDEFDRRLNPGAPADFSSPLSAGANWDHYGVVASDSVGPAIRGEEKVWGILGQSEEARQAVADGNQWIFGDMAIAQAKFLEQFPDRESITEDSIKQFFSQDHPMPDAFPETHDRRLFGDGRKQLRNGFLSYLDVMTEDDQAARQTAMLQGNVLFGTHEQAGIQNYLKTVGERSGEGGVMGYFDDPLARVKSGDYDWDPRNTDFGSKEEVVTDYMTATNPGTGETWQVDENVPLDSDLSNNLAIHADLAGDENPDNLDHFDIDGIVISVDDDFDGDVNLGEVAGWDDPKPGSGMDVFETDPSHWGTGDPGDTAVQNWMDAPSRMGWIGTYFQYYQTDPSMIAAMDTVGDWTEPGGHLDYLDGDIGG